MLKKTYINFHQSFLHPIYNWRYWPMELLYLPLTLYVFFIGTLRTGRLFYFAATNPKVPLGGFANDAKFPIIENIPKEYKPKTILISKVQTSDELESIINKEHFSFPLFVKPNIAEGGFLANKVDTFEELINYHANHKMDYLIQEFINYPMELSVLIHNSEGELKISSITERQHLQLIGDGTSNIEKLLHENKRANFKLKNILNQCKSKLHIVLGEGEMYLPTAVGNRGYGAKYVERTEIINATLTKELENINAKVGLFNYARYDVMCSSIEEFLQGRMIILEINGVKGEPIHIYDEKYSLYQAYVEIFKHWEFILKISMRNMKQGFVCPGIREGFSMLIHHYLIKKTSRTKRN